jgi:mono/diheme cytochrome c family protein
MRGQKINRFWSVVLTLLIVYGLVRWGIPAVSRYVTTLPFPLPVPGTLMFFYMTLTVIALFLLVTFSDEHMEEFLQPIRKFLCGGYGKVPRLLGLTAVPLLAAWQMYDITVPKLELPSALRIQHPSSNFPKKFEALKNPLANPSDADIDAFIKQVKANKIEFIPQVMEDIKRWMEKEGEEKEGVHMLGFFPSKAFKTLLAQSKKGQVDRPTAKAALLEKYLFEGRALYAMNCRACHGDSVGGDGPMADGFKLRPINFTDNGTIETIVEGYTFWRVSNGGPGLPTEATPWDSAMPEWKLNLTEEQRWKIILAEYDLAGKTPRIPEGH